MSRFLTLLEDVEITRAKDVKKHGDHDQSSHGSWAQGLQVAPEIVRSTLESVKANGGLTVDMKDGSSPKDGFMVAKGKKFAAIVKADDFFDEAKGSEILSSYMKQHKSEFNNSNNYLGLWHNTNDGQVYLDVSENIKDEGEAISRGRERDQISIWDVANLKEIETGGTGGIEKTRGSTTARFVEYDRRTDRRLRQRDLGKVSKTLKVIYFDYGLKPVLKHEGHEDQSSHGNWATGRSEEDVKRISEMKDKGPTLNNLDEALESFEGVIDRDKARMLIDNESYLNDEVEDRINMLITANEELSGKPMSEEERLANYDDYRNQVVEDYIDQEPDFLENYSQENQMGSIYEPQVTESMMQSLQEVYGLETTSVFRDGPRQGESVTLTSTVEEVVVEGNDIIIKSNILDDKGNQVNSDDVVRILSKDETTGTWSVEHKFLKLESEYRGLGFGSKFLQQSEDWYVAKGLTHITLNAGLVDGARHWANSGFDWNRDELSFIVDTLETSFNEQEFNIDGNYTELMPVSQKMFAEDLAKGREILGRMKDSSGKIRDMKEDDFPTPKEFASLGASRPLVTKDGKSTWAGKELLEGKYMPYMKVLTAEGQNLLSGPVDMDGDGLVYDGTPREKPVSSVGKK